MSKPLTLMFVCTANICRSTFAHALAENVAGPDRLRVISAGTHAKPGLAMDPLMVAELSDRGVRSPQIASERTVAANLREADLVLTMTVEHRTYLLEDFPQFVGKLYTLGQFAKAMEQVPESVTGAELLKAVKKHRGRASKADDIADPYGKGYEPTHAAAEQIDELVRGVVARLAA